MLTVDPWGSIRRPSDKPTGTIICDAPLTKLAPARARARRRPADRRRPATQGHAACASPFRSEADAAGEDERLATTDLPATLHERGECAALHLERRATEQIQPRLRGAGAAHACNRCVGDVQPT